MKIHIVGAGAIGGMAGWHMAKNGEDVTFVDQWFEHVEAMKEEGLRITGLRGDQRIPVKAKLPQEIDEDLELVFVACKSQHTEAAVRGIMEHLTPSSVVVSLQNGMNEEKIAGLIGPERVIGALPDYTAALVDPGHLEFTVTGPVYVGELDGSTTPRVLEVQRLLSYLTDAKLTNNIIGRVWTKQVYGCWIVMTALVDASTREVWAADRNRLLSFALVREATRVADAYGIKLEADAYFLPDLIRQTYPEARRSQIAILGVLSDHLNRRSQTAVQMPDPNYQFVKKGSGMWWDLVYRNRKTETRWIVGDLIERGAAKGIDLKLNKKLAEMIYEIEDGKRLMRWENLDELADYATSLGEPMSVDA
ncbi:MAG TPA: 2-dehydropantoate 2-reductase [Chloroflexota bacterium]|nr:2-dehydropantoate 2-reductase [Chloroflexota bacterium]